MKLRSVYISFFEYSNAPDVDARGLDFQSRALCNYVQRAARKMAIPTEGFNAIIVRAAREGYLEHGPARIVPVKCLQVPFAPDWQRLCDAEGDAIHLVFAKILRDGLRSAAEVATLPIDALLRLVDEFVDGGFENAWLHRRRMIRGTGLKGELRCSLTREAFRLTLALVRKGEDVYAKQILETKPDELCFHYKFDDIVWDGSIVRVVGKGARSVLFESPLADLLPD